MRVSWRAGGGSVTETPGLATAVQIAARVTRSLGLGMTLSIAEDVVAALAGAGWLHDPAEVAALREWRKVPDVILSQLLAIREDIKYGYPEHAGYLARLATGWGVDSALDAAPAADPTRED